MGIPNTCGSASDHEELKMLNYILFEYTSNDLPHSAPLSRAFPPLFHSTSVPTS